MKKDVNTFTIVRQKLTCPECGSDNIDCMDGETGCAEFDYKTLNNCQDCGRMFSIRYYAYAVDLEDEE